MKKENVKLNFFVLIIFSILLSSNCLAIDDQAADKAEVIKKSDPQTDPRIILNKKPFNKIEIFDEDKNLIKEEDIKLGSTATLEVHITDINGATSKDIKVSLYDQFTRQELKSKLTNYRGIVEFLDVKNGKYTVRFTKTDGAVLRGMVIKKIIVFKTKL